MSSKSGQQCAVIIGAGAGGIATAARLSKAGFLVTVVEKNDFTGGRCSLIHHDGYRFDQGPSLLLLPGLFRELFHDLGTTLEAEGVNLLKCEPNYNIWFGDGERFHLSTDLTRMKREIEQWEGKEGFERYLKFLQESHRHYEISVTHVLHKNFTSILSLMRPSFLPHLLELHPFESIYSRASKYFFTERLRRVFTFASMYMGMSPFDAPGTYSLLQYTELAEGIWYPEGGFHKILDAVVKIGQRNGVKFRFNSSVSSIKLSSDGKTAKGVVLSSGELLEADLVICNSDLVYSYNNLLPPTSYARSLEKRKSSCSSISFYWAIDRVVPELDAHNIFIADEYRESFDSIFNDQSLPTEPSFYVNVPSRIDPSAAPRGKDAIVVLCPVGHFSSPEGGTGLKPQDSKGWKRLIARARHAVLKTIEARTGAVIEPHITNEIINSPISWNEKFNLDKGAILGLSHSFFNVLSFRPRTKHQSIQKLYFVGASTHPGTGVPIVVAGSKITSEQILQDLGVSKPWADGFSHLRRTQRKAGRAIDKVQSPAVLSPGDLAIVVLVMIMCLWASLGNSDI